jgi:hypothetical protein
MSDNDTQLIELCFVSILKVLRRHSTTEELAKTVIDTLGIFDASEIAFNINELEKSISTNEPLS